MNEYYDRILKFVPILFALLLPGCSGSLSNPTETPKQISTPTFILPPMLTSTFTKTITHTPTFTFTSTTFPASTGGGGKIIYTLRHVAGSREYGDIYLYDLSLGKEIPLVVGNQIYPSSYSWSPDNKQIVFNSLFNYYTYQLMIVDVGTGKLRTIAHTNKFSDMWPSWSPDGRRIVFIGDGNLFLMNVDETNLIRLTNFGSGTPDWSPNGQKIAFSILQGEKVGIYVINVNGNNLVRLTNFGDSPKWSPDGEKIMFQGSPYGNGDWSIYIMNADGSDLKTIEDGISVNADPSWSPDGRLIAFYTEYTPDCCIYIMDADGTNARILPTSPNAIAPEWSH